MKISIRYDNECSAKTMLKYLKRRFLNKNNLMVSLENKATILLFACTLLVLKRYEYLKTAF